MSGRICWIDSEPCPGWHNMAVDEAMLDRAVASDRMLLRLYRWAPYCLSFGRHEPAARRYERPRIQTEGRDCVRRPTGGRAVWHAGELTYALAAPTASLGSLREAFVTIHQWLAAGLRRLGATTALAPPRRARGLGSGPCFATTIGGEVTVEGKKVVGSAQRRVPGGLLQHGSILIEHDQSVARALLRKPQAPRTDPPEAPLNRLLPTPTTFEAVAASLADELLTRGFPPLQERPPNDVTARAPLHFDRFQSETWTWER